MVILLKHVIISIISIIIYNNINNHLSSYPKTAFNVDDDDNNNNNNNNNNQKKKNKNKNKKKNF